MGSQLEGKKVIVVGGQRRHGTPDSGRIDNEVLRLVLHGLGLEVATLERV
jgi:hypothetical protein